MANLISAARVRFEELRELDFSDISSSSFVAVGTPFDNPLRLLKMTNLTNATLYVSDDGVTNKDIVGAGGVYLYDFSSNKSSSASVLELSKGDRIYVKARTDLPTDGVVAVTTLYASQV